MKAIEAEENKYYYDVNSGYIVTPKYSPEMGGSYFWALVCHINESDHPQFGLSEEVVNNLEDINAED